MPPYLVVLVSTTAGVAVPGVGSGFSCAVSGLALPSWEQDSTSLALNIKLPLPGRAECVFLSLHVRGGNLAANISVMTIYSGAETWPMLYEARSKGFVVCSLVTEFKTELPLMG